MRKLWISVSAVLLGAAAFAAAPVAARASGPVPLPAGLSNQSLVQQFSPSTLVSSAWNPTNSPGNCPTQNNGAFVNSSGYAEIDTNGAVNDCRSIQSPQANLPTAPGTTYEALQKFSSFQDWPAYWMYGPNWPNQGEIDAVEGGPGASTVTWHQAGNFTIGPDPWDNQQVSLAGNPNIQPGTWTTTDISFTTTGVDVYYQGLLYVHIPESVTTGGTDPMFLTISEGSCNANGTNVCNGGTPPPGSVQTQWVREFSASGGGGQQAPAATTSAATGVTSSAATLNGSVNPEGAGTTYKFDYGTTAAYGSSTTAGNAGSGTTAVGESAGISGLSPSTTYHYRIEATNSGGTTFGSDQQFATTAAGATCVIRNDASSPVRVQLSNTTAATATTASFSPPAGSDDLVQVSTGFDTGQSTGPTVTVKDSQGTVFTAGPSSWDGNGEGSYVFSHYYATAPGSITVAATRAGAQQAAMFSVNTRVLTGAAASQAGAATLTASGSGTTAEIKSFTPTVVQSDTEVMTTEANTPTLTASGLTTDSSWFSGNDGEATASGHVKAASLSPITAGWNAASATNWALAGLEVRPATNC